MTKQVLVIGILFLTQLNIAAEDFTSKKKYFSFVTGWVHGFNYSPTSGNPVPNVRRGLPNDNQSRLTTPLRKIVKPSTIGFAISEIKYTGNDHYIRSYVSFLLNDIVSYRYTSTRNTKPNETSNAELNIDFRPISFYVGQSKTMAKLYTDSKQKKLMFEYAYGVGLHYLNYFSNGNYSYFTGYDSLQFIKEEYRRVSPIGITLHTGFALQIVNQTFYGLRLELLYSQGLNPFHTLSFEQINTGETEGVKQTLYSRASNVSLNLSYPLFSKKKKERSVKNE